MKYEVSGDFFGELALKSGSDGVRRASVVCALATDCVDEFGEARRIMEYSVF